MPRSRRGDSDELDDEPIRSPKRSNTVLYVVLAVVGFVVLGCAGGSFLAMRFLGRVGDAARRTHDAKNEASAAKVWDEDELSKEVEGKTPDEVIGIMKARPDYTSGNVEKDRAASMIYRDRLWDKIAGKPVNAEILFNDGRATDQVR